MLLVWMSSVALLLAFADLTSSGEPFVTTTIKWSAVFFVSTLAGGLLAQRRFHSIAGLFGLLGTAALFSLGLGAGNPVLSASFLLSVVGCSVFGSVFGQRVRAQRLAT